jgi:hypothetical protein
MFTVCDCGITFVLIPSYLRYKCKKSSFIARTGLRMNWSNIEKWRKLLKIGTIVLLSMLKYCAKLKKK